MCHETLNLAAVWKLPVVFVCENNLYGLTCSTKFSLPIDDIADRASGYGMPGVVVDGTRVNTRTAPEFIQRKLELHVIMDALAEGHAPIIKQVGTKAESLRSAILAELEEKYGGQ